MPDPAIQLRRDTKRLIDRVRQEWQSAIGIELPAAQRLAGNATAAALLIDTPPDAFATGYDGTETTMVFTFDFSRFDGPDTLG